MPGNRCWTPVPWSGSPRPSSESTDKGKWRWDSTTLTECVVLPSQACLSFKSTVGSGKCWWRIPEYSPWPAFSFKLAWYSGKCHNINAFIVCLHCNCHFLWVYVFYNILYSLQGPRRQARQEEVVLSQGIEISDPPVTAPQPLPPPPTKPATLVSSSAPAHRY